MTPSSGRKPESICTNEDSENTRTPIFLNARLRCASPHFAWLAPLPLSGVNQLRCADPVAQHAWIPADDDEPSFHWQDAHHSIESPWKPREVPLDDDRILALDAD
jgi:hypothetical protein